jgi:hypothetical protein
MIIRISYIEDQTAELCFVLQASVAMMMEHRLLDSNGKLLYVGLRHGGKITRF